METLILIDGNSLINRAYYALPQLNGKDGKPTQAVYGFVTMLVKLFEYKPTYMAVAFDMQAPTFRHKQYEHYKANRKGMPDDLAVQLPVLKELLTTMGITYVQKEGYEADDIIGTMAKNYDGPTYIVTGDRDSFQLIDASTKVLMTKRGITEVAEFDVDLLRSEYQLSPSGVVVYKALAGDASDNITGVPGIGSKTATELVNRYETLDNLYAHLDEFTGKLKDKLSAGKESAYISQMLATIDTQVPEMPNVINCKVKFPFDEKVKETFDALNFRSLIKREELFSSISTQAENLSECKEVNLEQLKEAVLSLGDKAVLIIEKSGIYIGDQNVGYRLPLRESLLDEGADEAEAIEAIKDFAEGEKLKIVYDAKTLKKRLRVFGAKLNNFFDVELCQYLLNSNVEHESLIRLGEEYGLKGGVSFVLFRMYDMLYKELISLGKQDLYFGIELPLIDVLMDMEQTGFAVDRSVLDELSIRYASEISLLQKRIIDLAGKNFNINSPKQLATVLFEELKIPYPKKSKSYSTGAEILEPLRGNFEIIDKVLDYRFLCKLKNTYLDGLKPLIDDRGLVHTEFKQMLTSTGRLSSVEPNLQNIPIRTEEGKGLRKLFIARGENILVSADYSQIELRLMAHLSGDPLMTEAYLSGEDIHASTAAEIYGVSISEVTSEMRREAKAVNFGIIYGISDFGLAQNLGIMPKQARTYIDRYFMKFKGVKDYLDRTVEYAYEHGYVETLYGRRRYIPELKSANRNQRLFGERVAMNTPLQGSAADIIKAAMIDVFNRLKGMKSKLILQIHDELIVDADKDEEENVKSILIDSMENVIKLNVPLKVEVGRGKRWFDCK